MTEKCDSVQPTQPRRSLANAASPSVHSPWQSPPGSRPHNVRFASGELSKLDAEQLAVGNVDASGPPFPILHSMTKTIATMSPTSASSRMPHDSADSLEEKCEALSFGTTELHPARKMRTGVQSTPPTNAFPRCAGS
jgi:hypothetical protein